LPPLFENFALKYWMLYEALPFIQALFENYPQRFI